MQAGEIVHHMNSDATDNDTSNLLIMTDKEQMQPENADALNRIEQEIIEVQAPVLTLYKAKQNCSVSASDYATQVQTYSQRMQDLEVQKEEQKSVATRYSEAKSWLDTFEKHISDGSVMDADDSTTLKQLAEQIIAGTGGIEIQFKCGVSIEKDYNSPLDLNKSKMLKIVKNML